MPTAEFPVIDYGAIYENAKARREAEELRKLEYLNSFQKERGAFAPGVYDELNNMFKDIQADIAEGDMSFDARKRRQEMYNQYKDAAAMGLQWSQMLNEYEAGVLAAPDQYNDPDLLLKKIQEDRTMVTPIAELEGKIGGYPSLGTFRRFAMNELSPNSAAGTILGNLKAGGGIQDFYDMAGTGALKPEVVNQVVSDYYSTNSLSKEEEDQAIAFVLRHKGALTGGAGDLSKVRNLSEEDRVRYMGDYAVYVARQLQGLIADDVETQREEDARALRLAERKSRIEMRLTSEAEDKELDAVIEPGNYNYTPPLTEVTETGSFMYDPANLPEEATTEGIAYSAKLHGPVVKYVDGRGVTKYVERIAIDEKGVPMMLVRYNQDAQGAEGPEKYVAREMIPWEEAMASTSSGITSKPQLRIINSTFNKMLGMLEDAPGVKPIDKLIADINSIGQSDKTKTPAAEEPVLGLPELALPKGDDDPIALYHYWKEHIDGKSPRPAERQAFEAAYRALPYSFKQHFDELRRGAPEGEGSL